MLFEDAGQFASRARPTGYRLCDHVGRPGQGRWIEPELLVAAGVACDDPRPAEIEEPAEVLWSDVVPRWAQHVGPQDVALVETPVEHRPWRGRPGALRDRPSGIDMLLGLHGREVTYGGFGGG